MDGKCMWESIQDNFEFHGKQFLLSVIDNGQLLDVFQSRKKNKSCIFEKLISLT